MEETKCVVCDHDIEENRRMICGHYACYKCLYQDSPTTLFCPICKRLFTEKRNVLSLKEILDIGVILPSLPEERTLTLSTLTGFMFLLIVSSCISLLMDMIGLGWMNSVGNGPPPLSHLRIEVLVLCSFGFLVSLYTDLKRSKVW